jgi:protein BCP1
MNMPTEVVPPMYSMLLEEMSWAIEEKEPYEFTHYLIISKAYTEVESQLDKEDSRPQKKSKKSGDKEIFHFHPEDEILHQHAIVSGGYDYTKQEGEGKSDSKRAFQELGVKPQGRMILIDGAKFNDVVKAIGNFVNPAS